ncbi:xanthine dehydrogenase family protein molybdopterin-binding subunit [Megalodesulfovibrio gigas]|uniref:Putative aerobic-type carbon monoxide dehydrogenase, large subunit CoxL/CutL-like protein n=1 Tax=Megalodesulfovibrio gigas (strain ATCC 19364 / DSM 1382 / NCIMB 9332 / VKM B-1759) TaxID=1121448 RepID=T2GEY9_MEGG1|nr:xanthine dehydrogenase family protein molybdopterin-binding subunit [Megalodesulfovibrio gigas]AGW14858.1 putative aerobic-type carbon monoxide dehydrogenase, large subunit CoxL/CutL-like protein [Megalodesulfovibrio gigas DSM 1382 = ATCC 19364]
MADKGYFDPVSPLPQPSKPGEAPRPWGQTTLIGQRIPRVDAYERVSGAAVYPSDIRLPGMLHAAILHCPHAHAIVRGLETAKARAMPGVRDIITAGTPGADIQWPYAEGRAYPLFDPHLRFEGEEVAAVVADTPWQAWDAARAIEVRYDERPAAVAERLALTEKAPNVHPGGNLARPVQAYARGDLDKGLAEAAVVLTGSFRTASQLHIPLERHGCVAMWDGDGLTVWESTQGVFPVQEKLAAVLGLPLSRVRVRGEYMGGGFGSKLETSKYAVIAAILARRTGRPVKLFLSREQTMLSMGLRPAAHMEMQLAAKADGTLTGISFSGLASGGAYGGAGTALVDWPAKDLYRCPNVRTELTDVLLHSQPARPFRAPGYPQGAWAVEQMMDRMADALGLDPVALRLQNIPTTSQAREGAPAYTTTGLKACLEEGAAAFGWQESRQRTAAQPATVAIRRGVGMAACNWLVGGGFPPSTVVLKLLADGSVILNMGASDIGGGTKTIMAMVVAEELGVTLDRIHIEHADTATTQYATASGGSKTVPTEAPAVREAAQELKRQLLAWAAEELGMKAETLRYEGASIVVNHSEKQEKQGKQPQRVAVTALARLRQQRVALGVGHKRPNPKNKTVCPFGAQFCEVEVNTGTGEIRVVRFLACHESGRVMNRLTYDCQVYGGMTMGAGFALTEGRILDADSGKLCNRNLHDYKLPTMLDVPADIVSLPLDLPDDAANSTGAKGLGEPVVVPTAPAIANAIADALRPWQVRLAATPITPAAVLQALAAAKEA